MPRRGSLVLRTELRAFSASFMLEGRLVRRTRDSARIPHLPERRVSEYRQDRSKFHCEVAGRAGAIHVRAGAGAV
jgi:hypothetical protein